MKFSLTIVLVNGRQLGEGVVLRLCFKFISLSQYACIGTVCSCITNTFTTHKIGPCLARHTFKNLVDPKLKMKEEMQKKMSSPFLIQTKWYTFLQRKIAYF